MKITRSAFRSLAVAAKLIVVFTVLLGIVYPLSITAIGQIALPRQANGSLLSAEGDVVGSRLLGQEFTDSNGDPLAEYFQTRPSAAGEGYDGGQSSGSNLGPNNPTLVELVSTKRAEIAAFNGVPESEIPADAVTASSSGLDPHISPEYARVQAARVAQARGLPLAEVRDLVERSIEPRDLGFLGEPRVNVLVLNTELDKLKG